MLVLASYTAALYAAVVIPFKFGLPLVPGATEVRPGIAVLLLCSFLFGPAAAWGGAFGNLIGDFFGGTLGPGSFFGFFGNFLYAYVPYKMWEVAGGKDIAGRRGFGWWWRYILVCWASSAICASVIAWGIELVLGIPTMILGGLIFANNLFLPILIGPALIRLVTPRLEEWGLTYRQVEPDHPRPAVLAPIGGALIGAAGLAAGAIMVVGFVVMFLPDWARHFMGQFPWIELLGRQISVGKLKYSGAMLAISPLIVVFIIGSFLLGHEKSGKQAESDSRAAAIQGLPLHGGKIALVDVTFSYATSDNPALKNVSFSVGPGEYVVIMGRTGAGKTSLTRCFTGAIPHFFSGRFSGKAYLFGRDLSQTGPAENADLVGAVFQDFESQLFSTNMELEAAFGAENLGMPRDKLLKAVESSLKAVGLAGFGNRNPTTLSGGEKQRLAIASILAMNPPLMILDEPSTDLDPVGKREIFDALATIKREDRPVILVEHEIEAARRADRIVLMRDGEIIREGAPLEIFRDPQLLLDHGIRPLDGVKLLCALGDSESYDPYGPPLSVEEQVDRLKQIGKIPSSEKHEALEEADESRAASYGDVIYDLRNLHHSYGSGGDALNGVSLTIRKGEFIAVLGQNGSGKTTLAKHLNGLLAPTKGEALFKGKPVTARPLSTVAREVGFVFQDPDHQIFSSTVGDEVAFAPRNFGLPEDEIALRIKKAMEFTSLEGYEDKDPFHLTKGERQRVAVAGMLAGEPEVLILDEPTTGLDRDEQVRIMELLKRLNSEGHTIIIITHTVWVAAEYAHRTVLLASGKVIADGPTRKVFGMDDKLKTARVQPPDITAIGKAFGKVFLSVEEYLGCV